MIKYNEMLVDSPGDYSPSSDLRKCLLFGAQTCEYRLVESTFCQNKRYRVVAVIRGAL